MSKKALLNVKLVKSPIGAIPKHRATVLGLGLKKMNQVRALEDTACVRGMINSVRHLVEVIEV